MCNEIETGKREHSEILQGILPHSTHIHGLADSINFIIKYNWTKGKYKEAEHGPRVSKSNALKI